MNDVNRAQQQRNLIAALIALLTTAVPAMIVWEVPGALSSAVVIAIATIGGGVAGRILCEPGERVRAHVAAMLGGVVAGAGASIAVTWWLARRSSVSSPEIALAVTIGAVPGVIVGGKLYLALRRPVERVPRASVR